MCFPKGLLRERSDHREPMRGLPPVRQQGPCGQRCTDRQAPSSARPPNCLGMRAYNETAVPGEDLHFYGFDLQNYEHSHQLLLEEMRKHDLDTTELESLGELRERVSGDLDRDLVAATYEDVHQQLESLPDDDTALALQLVDCLLRNDELGRADNAPESYGVRDRLMAQNVLWILAQEERRSNQRVLVSTHNGHIEQAGTYGPDAKVMGALLSDKLGDGYYAIGTDFFRAEVNLPKGGGKRMTHTFFSHDPLAHAASRCGFERCWLDFASVPGDSPLRPCIDEPIMMGSVGEGFNPLMYVLPQTYRVRREPSGPYCMIFVPYAHPTEIRPPRWLMRPQTAQRFVA